MGCQPKQQKTQTPAKPQKQHKQKPYLLLMEKALVKNYFPQPKFFYQNSAKETTLCISAK